MSVTSVVIGNLYILNYGPDSGWGTSVVLPPSFWAGGTYNQGTAVAATWNTDGGDLLLTFSGTISTLGIEGEVRLSPPADNAIAAQVSVTTNGTVELDSRPGEAFKLVMLSSMHISENNWDAQSAFAEAQTYPLPESGWIIDPSVNGTILGLTGGTSLWKTNAPTVEIVLAQAAQITGWVTGSGDPNDDNLGLWAASDEVLSDWSYTITTKSP
ncbi:MAG: hypothetical protein KJ950_02045 [Proteobacteria bacterium]|nr:hypothetical protein [Pseudomonadota bacterium]MBU1688281.1 hypothetical protein [Pseudomonadota bacterium]